MFCYRALVVVFGLTFCTLLLAAPASVQLPKAASPAKFTSQGFSYTVAKLPAWVDSPAAPPVRAQADSGWHYVQHDEQLYASAAESERHINIVRRVNTAAGLTDAARIELVFEPSYESLVMHELSIRRSGQVINKLNAKNISLLRREQGLDQLRYDGFVTASMNIDDLRVGDLITYRYTVIGANPALQGRFSTLLPIKLSVASDLTRYRIVRNASRPLRFDGGDLLDRRDADLAGMKETVFTGRDMPPAQYRENSPPAEAYKNLLSITQFNDWADVAQWGQALFAIDGKPQPALSAQVKQIMATAGSNPLARAEAALAFVQKDIRYFSILFGASSHRPAAPDRVLEQRFGDCKDKTLLLITLLKEMGIDAYPVLVSHYLRGDVVKNPASHTAFDHAITGVEISGKTYWLDGTRTLQSGALEARQAWAFGHGLPLRAGVTALVPAPARVAGEIDVVTTDTFTIGAIGEPASLNSTMTFAGEWAERIQGILDGPQRNQVANELFAYFGRRYESAVEAKPFSVTPTPAKGELEVSREWRVPEAFELFESKTLVGGAAPWSIFQTLSAGFDNQRDTAVYLGQKQRKRHIVEYNFAEAVVKDTRESTTTIDSKFFKLTLAVNQRPKNVTLTYDFETLVETIPAGEIKSYQEKVREATTKATGQVLLATVPLDKVDALQSEVREFAKKIDRRQIKYATSLQERAAFDLIVDTAKLNGTRLSPKNRATILRDRAIAYDHLMQTEKALADLNESIKLDPNKNETYGTLAEVQLGRGEIKQALATVTEQSKRSFGRDDGFLYQRARVNFYAGEFASAVTDLEARIKAAGARDKAYAWLWLDMASKRLGGDGNERKERLAEYANSIKHDGWPMPIVKYYRGEIDEDAVLKAAKDSNDTTQRWQLCEANYFIGQRYLHSKDTRAAKRAFERARDTEVFEFIEYRASGIELERLAK
jgi:lipoprotein NlpI